MNYKMITQCATSVAVIHKQIRDILKWQTTLTNEDNLAMRTRCGRIAAFAVTDKLSGTDRVSVDQSRFAQPTWDATYSVQRWTLNLEQSPSAHRSSYSILIFSVDGTGPIYIPLEE